MRVEADDALQLDRAHLREILAILRTRTKHDFNGYRKATLLRRIQRRMGLVDTEKLSDYAAVLRSSTNEVGALANDLMINVTGFFRDPEAWEALRVGVIAPLVASKQEGQTDPLLGHRLRERRRGVYARHAARRGIVAAASTST